MPLRLQFIILGCVMLSLASVSAFAQKALPGYESAKNIIDSRGSDPLSGIWRIGGGATVAFLPVENDCSAFDIIILDSNDMSVIPGTSIGHARATGKIGVYDAELSHTRPGAPKKVRCIVTLGKDGRLAFDYYKQGYTVRLWRLIPYLFRFSVNRQDTRPNTADGAVRLYPPTGQEGPVML